MNGLLWIAVPAGLDGDQAVLRVLISPQLDPDGPRRMRDEAMAAWPALLREDVLFEIETTVGATTRAVIAEHHDDLQPDVWEAFFGSEAMRVMPRAQRRRDYVADPFVPETSKHADYIAQLYPALAQVLAPGSPAPGAADALPGQAPWVGSPRPDTPPRPADRTDRAREQTVHFDRVVGLLREHPTVLRALGLIVDLRVDAARLRHPEPPSPNATGVIRVTWREAPGSWQIESPLTRYEVTAERFSAASTDEVKDGLVDLRRSVRDPITGGEHPAWGVTTFDVDAAVDALAHAPVSPGGGPAQPPHLRSAGLMLMRRGRQAELSRRRANATRNAKRASRTELELTADDLVLGYRIDVKPENGAWLSLCRRCAKYRVNDIVIGAGRAAEEGHVKAAGAVIDASGELRGDEVVARWSGWSLVVAPPNFDHRLRDVDAESRQRMPYRFEFEFEVEPRTLPKLRFGRAYQLRCRVADVTGGGRTLDEPLPDATATDPVRYLRHEPVHAPVLSPAPGVVLGPGATVERLVVRSDAAGAPDARLVTPPPSTRALAEQHGWLDGAGAATFDLVRRGTELPDPAAGGVTVHVPPSPRVIERALTTDQTWDAWLDPSPKRLELRAAGAGTDAGGGRDEDDDEALPDLLGAQRATREPRMAWEGQTLVVWLAPAQRMSLELSSTLRSELAGQFALTASLGDAAARHPMLTPARTLELVHAVKRPLQAPVGPLTPIRSEAGDTFVTLQPPGDEPLLGVDPASTARIDIAASWIDREFRRVDGGVVASATLEPDSEELPELRHELGDTTQRAVSYEVTAISRFRDYWPASTPQLSASDPEFEPGFLVSTTFPAVSVKSAARPPAPVVISSTPAFSWREGADPAATEWRVRERIRAGGVVRVELERPWFTTGSGEKLAVVVWPENPAPGDLWPLVSQVANDPIWDTTPPDRFPVQGTFGEDGLRARPARLSETGDEVLAVPYQVGGLPSPTRCFADVALPGAAAASYCPFAQLAVARYQPDSIAGLELSPVVRTEMVPLLPERRLRIERRGSGVIVSLAGIGPRSEAYDRVVARVERFTGRPADVFAVDLVAYTEDPPDDRTPIWVPLADSAAWGKLGDEMTLAVPPSGGPYRIHVREVDNIPGQLAFEPETGAEIWQRTVFAEAVVLPGAGVVVHEDPDPPAGGE